jgi:hypothetical protein
VKKFSNKIKTKRHFVVYKEKILFESYSHIKVTQKHRTVEAKLCYTKAQPKARMNQLTQRTRLTDPLTGADPKQL